MGCTDPFYAVSILFKKIAVSQPEEGTDNSLQEYGIPVVRNPSLAPTKRLPVAFRPEKTNHLQECHQKFLKRTKETSLLWIPTSLLALTGMASSTAYHVYGFRDDLSVKGEKWYCQRPSSLSLSHYLGPITLGISGLFGLATFILHGMDFQDYLLCLKEQAPATKPVEVVSPKLKQTPQSEFNIHPFSLPDTSQQQKRSPATNEEDTPHWVWLGVAAIALGIVIALAPESAPVVAETGGKWWLRAAAGGAVGAAAASMVKGAEFGINMSLGPNPGNPYAPSVFSFGGGL